MVTANPQAAETGGKSGFKGCIRYGRIHRPPEREHAGVGQGCFPEIAGSPTELGGTLRAHPAKAGTA
ncbi:MAG: hypothetical protein JWM59_213 [Verrucomicrobiales bacterium]|nr:hypothetical protein [Verrucomicrobiales bacterium]